jgi:hypothetical protein
MSSLARIIGSKSMRYGLQLLLTTGAIFGVVVVVDPAWAVECRDDFKNLAAEGEEPERSGIGRKWTGLGELDEIGGETRDEETVCPRGRRVRDFRDIDHRTTYGMMVSPNELDIVKLGSTRIAIDSHGMLNFEDNCDIFVLRRRAEQHDACATKRPAFRKFVPFDVNWWESRIMIDRSVRTVLRFCHSSRSEEYHEERLTYSTSTSSIVLP